MHFGVARIAHRSNSFARNATDFTRFREHEFLTGQGVANRYLDTGTLLGKILASAQDAGISMRPILSASAPAGGPVTRECIDELGIQLVNAITESGSDLDGVLLDLSGTITTIDATSGDEELVRTFRNTFPSLPLVVTLPQEANVTARLVEASDRIVAASPANGGRALQALMEVVQGGRSSKPAHRQLPLLIPVAAQRPDQQPMSELLELIEKANPDSDPTSAAFFSGYPYADFPGAGASVIVYSEALERRDEVATELERAIWERRNDFFVPGSNVEEAVHHAMDSKDGPILIADLGDNPDDGAPGDGTTVLWALLDLGVRNATVGAIADEQAVAACVRAGVGATMEMPIGGRLDTRHGYPIDVRGTVVSLHEGSYRLNGPIETGLEVDPGQIAVLNLEARHDGSVEVILTEKPTQIIDTSLFEHIGIDVMSRKIVSIKSINDYRPAFTAIASAIYEVITPGITTPDPAFFAYQNVRRPIYPLDAI